MFCRLSARNGTRQRLETWLNICTWVRPCSFKFFYNNILENAIISKLHCEFSHLFVEVLERCTQKKKGPLQLKPGAVSPFCQKRPVPYTIRPTLKKEFNRLIEVNVLTLVVSSERINPTVHLRRLMVRLCADFLTGLNAALDVHQFPLLYESERYFCNSKWRLYLFTFWFVWWPLSE